MTIYSRIYSHTPAIAALAGILISSAPSMAAIQSFGDRVSLGAPPQACRLSNTITIANQKFSDFACSGTYIAGNRILTAAHCATQITFGIPGSETIVECGTGKVPGVFSASAVVIGAKIDPAYLRLKKTNPTFNLNLINSDTAVLDLDRPIQGIPPAQVSAKSLYKPGTNQIDLDQFECRVTGFGQNERRRMGAPLYALLTPEDLAQLTTEPDQARATLKRTVDLTALTLDERECLQSEVASDFTPDQIIDVFRKYTTKINWTIAPGDSGGSILCRNKITGVETVFGVNSAWELRTDPKDVGRTFILNNHFTRKDWKAVK